MLAIGWQQGIRLRWLGKHTLFTGWRGPIMRGLGGIAVDRRDPRSLVEQLVAGQKARPYCLVITPEGTRGGGAAGSPASTASPGRPVCR